VKPRTSIKLPVLDIATRLASEQCGGAQKGFLTMYLQMGFERCAEEEKLAVAHVLVPNLAAFPEEQQYAFLGTLLPVLHLIDYAKSEAFESEQVRAIVLKFYFRVLLLTQFGLQNGVYV
jgi:hypothetical protein